MLSGEVGVAVGELLVNEGASKNQASGIIGRVTRAVTAAYPDARVRSGARGVTVFASGEHGFPVSVEDLGDVRLLYVGSGMIEFGDDDSLIEYVLRACSPDCRLHITRIGKTVREWKLVERDTVPETVLLAGGSVSVFSFFKRAQRSVYVNDRRASRKPEPGV